MARITVNGERRAVPDGWEDEPLLHVLREAFGLVGAKFGCGVGLCGACTVIVDGRVERSCLLPIGLLDGAAVRTVERLAEGSSLHPVQAAWLAEAVPQCGYCQAGQIMAAVALLEETPAPTDAEIDAAMDNLCRCGTYDRVRRAIHRAAEAAG